MKRCISALLLLAIVAGCSKSDDSMTQGTRPADAIYSYAGGFYTESQLKEDVNLREFIMREIITNNKGDVKRFMKDLPRLRAAWNDEMLVQSVVMVSAQIQAAKDGVAPTAEQRAKAEKIYTERIGNKVVDFAGLQKHAADAGLGSAFDRKFERELVLQSLREHVLSGDLGYGETNVCIFLTNATNAAIRAVAKNIEIYQMATNVVKRLRAGEDFYKLYDECCNLPEEDKKMSRKPAEYDQSDFASEEEGDEMWKMLKALPDNGVSDVLETDDGLVIYRVLKHIEESEQTQQFALKMDKIVIRRVVVMDIPPLEKARKMVKKCFEDDAIDKKMKESISTAKIDFGAGVTNLSQRVQQQLSELGALEH